MLAHMPASSPVIGSPQVRFLEAMPVTMARGGRAVNVLYAAPSGELGGVERFLDSLLPQHDPQRVRPVLVTLRDGPWPAAMRRRGVATHVVPDARLASPVATTRALLRILRAESIDLVHAAYAWTHAVLAPAAMLHGVPRVWFHHGPVWPRRWQGWTSLVPARALLTNSRYNLAALRRSWHLADEHHVQHLCVDADEFAPDAAAGARFRTEAGIPADALAIGIVGFIDDMKGQEVVLEAARRLAAAGGPRPHVVIAGTPRSGPAGARGRALLAQLHAQADTDELRGRVHFIGHVDVRAGVYDALDVAVQASTWPEAFGMVVLEAMAKGRAVIATDEGGPREFVRHAQDGWLIAPRDPGLLADALRTLLGDPSLRDRLAAGARARVLADFHPSRVATALEDYYARFVAVPPAG